jgi:hypothetical protein
LLGSITSFFDGKQHQCCFNSLRGVNEYKGLKNEKGKKEKLNLSKRERRIAQHHLNRTTEGEEGIQGLHQDLDQSTKSVGFSFHLHLTSAAAPSRWLSGRHQSTPLKERERH